MQKRYETNMNYWKSEEYSNTVITEYCLWQEFVIAMRVKQDHPPRTTDGTYKIVQACSSYHLKRGKEGPKSICFHWFPILQYFWTKQIPFSSNLQNDDTHVLANRQTFNQLGRIEM